MASESLPLDWSMAIDASSGRKYYFSQTGETRWDPPASDTVGRTSDPHRTPIEGQWKQHSQHQKHRHQIDQSETQLPQHHFIQETGPAVKTTPLDGSEPLVLRARSIVDQPESADNRIAYEQEMVSVGELADMVAIQRSRQPSADPYQPIRPYGLLVEDERPPIEAARLETRMHALQEQLLKIC